MAPCKCATMDIGGVFVEIFGIILMPVWFADNLGFHQQVGTQQFLLQGSVLVVFNAFTGAVGDVDLSFSSSAPIVLDVVTCSGSEEHLIDCGHAGIGVHSCHFIDGEATVLCRGKKYLMFSL